VRFKLTVLLTLLTWLAAFSATAAHTRVSLVLSAEVARPGETVLAGIHLRMDPDWHTYWINHGAAGKETSIKWNLPRGITAGEIQWPVPEKFPPEDLTTYGYKDEVVLLVPLRLANDLKPGPQELKAKVSWLECEQSCIPGSADVATTLNIGPETKSSAHAALIQAWQKKLPESGRDLSTAARWESPASGDTRPLVLEWTATGSGGEADFYPLDSDNIETQGATERLPSEAGKIRLRKLVKKFNGDWPKQISGVLVEKTAGQRLAFAASVPVASPDGQAAAGPEGKKSLALNLLYAFLGGLILNIMPCVFPVISLKILGFVQQSKSAPQQIFRHGLVYALGVGVSFLVFAVVVIAVQRATGSASWGMQLQHPGFTLALTVITLLVALNLFGVFEINLAGGVMNAAGDLAARQGMAGSFFNGVLAVLLATPCTAPYLAPAAGFAFTQPPAIIVLIFLTVALGLAFPYILLSWRPQWLKFLPRPGPWMLQFKIAMGFPMLATMVWLISFNARRFGPGGPLRLGLFLVIVAMAAWIWGQFVQRAGRRKAIGALLSLALFAGGLAIVFARDSSGWQNWSPEAVAKARAEGRPVLVDFTADWCLTCKYNKSVALDVAEVQARLKEINAVTLIGDNTDENPAILEELKRFERAGVPLVLVYPRNPAESAIVLPPLLTPGIVLDALQKAAN
jgi:thiol:disulfide interchange protein